MHREEQLPRRHDEEPSAPVYTKEEHSWFIRRYDGYDITTDTRYNLWLQVQSRPLSPKCVTSPLEVSDDSIFS